MAITIKICGITRLCDVEAAADAGADAIGLVFYPKSSRYVSIEQARTLALAAPPFMSVVGLFVNASAEHIATVLAAVPLNVLQFHGDEQRADCTVWQRPWIKAGRVGAGFEFAHYIAQFAQPQAGTLPMSGVLLDALVTGYGGQGQAFDWRSIPDMPYPIILSGGLNCANVSEAIATVKPAAVDVSSGVELSPGIKDASKIREFIACVRAADRADLVRAADRA